MENLSIKTSKTLLSISLICGFFFICNAIALGQPPLPTEETAQDATENFTNLGYISFSEKYTLAKNARNIVFKIRNNTTRSITTIYAWIYEVSKDDKETGSTYRLVNNPNKGGLPVKGGMHGPGTVVDWRFLLTSADKNNRNAKYTLRLSHRAIFFANMEPTNKPRNNGNNKENTSP